MVKFSFDKVGTTQILNFEIFTATDKFSKPYRNSTRKVIHTKIGPLIMIYI